MGRKARHDHGDQEEAQLGAGCAQADNGQHSNAIYAAVNTFEQYALPVAPAGEDQSPLAENRPETKPTQRSGRGASQNIEISKGDAAFDAGDVDAVLNDYDDDVEFVVPGNSTVSGTYRGKDGVKELFGKAAEQNFKLTPKRSLPTTTSWSSSRKSARVENPDYKPMS